MTTKIRYILLLCSLFGFFELVAQKNIIDQQLYWVRYYNMVDLNQKLTWHNEAEVRRFLDGDVQNQFIAHTRMHYKTGRNTNAAFGLTYSRQSPQNPSGTGVNLVVPEFRIVQEFNYTSPVTPRLSIQQRLRIDERFIRRNNGEELFSGYNFNLRFRYRIQANYLLSSDTAPLRTILKVANETMVNAGKNIVLNYFDQNRLYFGIEREFSRKISAELGYMKWFQQTAAGNTFFNRDIIRMTLYHRM